MASKQLDVMLYGLGAIGSFYAFILSRNPDVRLTVVARSNFEAVSANGFTIDSENHGNGLVVRPHKVVRTPAGADAKFDYIVCANKAIGQEELPARLAPAVDEDRTTIVIIQNGVGNEEPFRSAFPSVTIISCVTWVGARQHQPGFVTHTKSEDTQMGLFPNPASAAPERDQARLDEFAGLLRTGGTAFQVVPNVQVQRWEKVVWNVAWNSLTTLTFLDTHAWLDSSPGATPMTRRLMGEAVDVALALGVPLDKEPLIDRLMDKILAMPPIYSSMYEDARHGRPMEVDVILGYPTRKGRELGVSIPTLETIYTVLTGVNFRLLKASKAA
ncbi:2-dehydropantoate 2-reductase [Magnaporthiopsis poae ATCC 64411]|uniref:2-dehydropantoate 2-reductase n=1 Tax=Magnaporthiopsis poae (strain ATCC 64411 / 73-15) TaxID=644358 RepID=A0A0C4EGG6_MAGP6|nr:2-dehydropantoate 2-reductase [Magnaporthiopsis poae ATCC 64411]